MPWWTSPAFADIPDEAWTNHSQMPNPIPNGTDGGAAVTLQNESSTAPRPMIIVLQKLIYSHMFQIAYPTNLSRLLAIKSRHFITSDVINDDMLHLRIHEAVQAASVCTSMVGWALVRALTNGWLTSSQPIWQPAQVLFIWLRLRLSRFASTLRGVPHSPPSR